MIVALLVGILVGGSGGDAWSGLASKHLSDSVQDSVRRKAAEAVLDEMQAVVEAHTERVRAIHGEFDAVQRNYRATAADFRAIFRKIDRAWVDTENRLIKLRFKLLRQFTPKEWVDLNARVQADLDEARAEAEKKAG